MRSCSIVIPTINEEQNIPLLLNSLERVAKEHALTAEIIFVDDQSSDRTREMIRAYHGPLAVNLIVRENERGLAGAVVTVNLDHVGNRLLNHLAGSISRRC